MNYCCFLVKVISRPQQTTIKSGILLVQAQVQFAKTRKKKSFDRFKIFIWGNLAKHFIQNYRVGDYIIIEGILTFKKIPTSFSTRVKKQTRFTVRKLYPFLLPEEESFTP